MRRILLAVPLVLALAAGAGSAAPSESPEPWSSLRRPLHVPSLAPGAACPVSTRNPRGTLGDIAAEWGVTKAVWFTSRAYRGRLLVRGRQLDGPDEVRFEDGQPAFTPHGRLNPARELRLQNDASGHASTTRLRGPGCYAYQLDGATFSRLIVFHAVLEP